MLKLFFTTKELELLKKIEKYNTEELFSWQLPNVLYPFYMVALSIIGFLCFKRSELVTFESVINLLLNGSLLMFALNRTSSIGVNLLKFNRPKEKEAESDTYNIRLKINDYSKMLCLGIALFYIFQVIYTPFNLTWWVVIQLLLSGIVIYYAIMFSKFSYFLQERLFERTIGDEIREETIENKNHLKEKYGD